MTRRVFEEFAVVPRSATSLRAVGGDIDLYGQAYQTLEEAVAGFATAHRRERLMVVRVVAEEVENEAPLEAAEADLVRRLYDQAEWVEGLGVGARLDWDRRDPLGLRLRVSRLHASGVREAVSCVVLWDELRLARFDVLGDFVLRMAGDVAPGRA